MGSIRLASLAIVGALGVVSAPARASSAALDIDTTLGPVHGQASGTPGIREFLAIPYAAPPTGDARWRAPQPREPWTDSFDATTPGARCPQLDGGANPTSMLETNEDCLTLSVWSPDDAAGLPVMVFIHGGGLQTGSAHSPLYAGDLLADEGVVVINVNYRLGALGFLVTPELVDEGGGLAGNYGFGDQVAGLEWVRDNVTAFGGDPGNVTIFGESAGGVSVCAHLASETSAGLFHRAIVQSGGGCDGGQPLDEAAADGTEFLGAIGCEDVACLRALPADAFLDIPADLGTVLGGNMVAETARDQSAAGHPPTVPVLIGSNADEATLFTLGVRDVTDEQIESAANGLADDVDSVLAIYPAADYDDGLSRLRAIITDGFVCSTVDFASVAPASFVYHYTYVYPGLEALGATHASELFTLFGHPDSIGITLAEDDVTRDVTAALRAAWVQFATTGDPGWAAFGTDSNIQLLGNPPTLANEVRDGRCASLAELAGDTGPGR